MIDWSKEFLSTGDPVVGEGGQINWGDPESASDFFKADRAAMDAAKASREAAERSTIESRPLAPPGEPVDTSAPTIIGAQKDTPIFPVVGTFIGGPQSGYGAQRGSLASYARLHAGADWQAEDGSPVYSPTAGTVVYTGTHQGYGNVIDVLGPNGTVLRYAVHDGAVNVEPGQKIAAGQVLGTVGGGHLHHEIIRPGTDAAKAATEGRFGSTARMPNGVEQTINPMDYYKLQPNTKVYGVRGYKGAPAYKQGGQVTRQAHADGERVLPDGSGGYGTEAPPVDPNATSIFDNKAVADYFAPDNMAAGLLGSLVGGAIGGLPGSLIGGFAGRAAYSSMNQDARPAPINSWESYDLSSNTPTSPSSPSAPSTPSAAETPAAPAAPASLYGGLNLGPDITSTSFAEGKSATFDAPGYGMGLYGGLQGAKSAFDQTETVNPADLPSPSATETMGNLAGLFGGTPNDDSQSGQTGQTGENQGGQSNDGQSGNQSGQDSQSSGPDGGGQSNGPDGGGQSSGPDGGGPQGGGPDGGGPDGGGGTGDGGGGSGDGGGGSEKRGGRVYGKGGGVLSSDTHSIIDGLNRSKNAIMNNRDSIPARMLDMDEIAHLKLSKEEAAALDKQAAINRKKGDYFKASTFGNDQGDRWSVGDVLKFASKKPIVNLPTKGFVQDQVGKWWQGDVERAQKANPSPDQPILVLNHGEKRGGRVYAHRKHYETGGGDSDPIEPTEKTDETQSTIDAISKPRFVGSVEFAEPPKSEAAPAAPQREPITPQQLAQQATPPEDTSVFKPEWQQFLQDYPSKIWEGVKNIPSALWDVISYPEDIRTGRKSLYDYDAESGERRISNEAIDKAMSIQGLGITGSFPFAAQVAREAAAAGQMPMFMFGGPKAAYANLQKLKEAQQLAAQGVHRDQIWRQTGWGQDPFGNWFFEISDLPAKFTPEKPFYELQKQGISPQEISEKGFTTPLPSALEHENLYLQYPAARQITFEGEGTLQPRRGNVDYYGRFTPSENAIGLAPETLKDSSQALSTLIHEGQHFVDKYEGLPYGSSPTLSAKDIETARKIAPQLQMNANKIEQSVMEDAKRITKAAVNGDDAAAQFLNQSFSKWGKFYGFQSAETPHGITPLDSVFMQLLDQHPEYQALRSEMVNAFQLRGLTPEQAYNAHVGEVRARTSEARRLLADNERREIPPWYREGLGYKDIGYDVSEKQQVRSPRKDGGKVSSYPLRHHTDWEEAHDYEKTGGKLVHMSPKEYLRRTHPLEMNHHDKHMIHHFKKQMKKGVKLDPVAIFHDGRANGRHRAHAADELGIKKIPVVTWKGEKRLKRASGGISYSGDFTTPQYAEMYYQGLPQLGVTGQILSRLFPNPTTTGAYDAYMNSMQPSSSTAFQTTDLAQRYQATAPSYMSVPTQKSIGDFAMPSFNFNTPQANYGFNFGSYYAPEERLPSVGEEATRFSPPAPQSFSWAPVSAPASSGKKNGGSVVDRALMLVSKKA